MSEIRDIARRRRMTVSEWVRHALRTARTREPRTEAARKLQAIEEAMAHSLPTADIDEMLADVQRGILSSSDA